MFSKRAASWLTAKGVERFPFPPAPLPGPFMLIYLPVFILKAIRKRAHPFSGRLILLLLLCPPIIAADSAERLKALTETGAEPIRSGDALCKVAPGSLIKQEISGGESRTCEIQLNAHQYLQLAINKGDLKLSVALREPNGEKLFEYIDRSYGELELSLVVG